MTLRQYKHESGIKSVARIVAFRAVDMLSRLLNPRGPEGRDITGTIKKILIIDIGLLGDLLMTTPLIAGIKERFPDSHLTLVCTPWAAEAVYNNHHIDEVHLYEAFWEDRGTHSRPRLKHFRSSVRTVRYLRKHRYDAAFILTAREQPFVPFLGYLSGTKIRIGIDYPLGRRFLTHAYPDSGEHITKLKSQLLRVICQDYTPHGEMQYSIKKESLTNARRLIAENFGIESRPFVCITPSTLQVGKQWRLSSWIELINRLTDDGIGVVLGGGKADISYNEAIYSRVYKQALCKQMAGMMNLNEFAALMQLSACLVTVESAPMHIAAALRIPCIVMFSGMYNFKKFQPLHTQAVVLHKTVACAGCQKGCNEPVCMSFRVEEVISALSNIMPHKVKP